MVGPYLLWAFEFKPPLDPVTGSELTPKFEYKPVSYPCRGFGIGQANTEHILQGLVASPLPAKCRIIPRSDHHKEAIRREFTRAGAELQKFELEITDEDARYNKEHRDAR
jgi:hypothetical protein